MTITVPVQTNNLTNADGKPTEDMYRYMQSVKNTANALTASNATKAAKAQTWEQSFFIQYPEDGDYLLVLGAEIARTILKVSAICKEGSTTVTTKINSTALGGSANSVTTTKQDQAHATNNVQDVGENLVFTFSSTTACVGVSITVSGTLTLA